MSKETDARIIIDQITRTQWDFLRLGSSHGFDSDGDTACLGTINAVLHQFEPYPWSGGTRSTAARTALSEQAIERLPSDFVLPSSSRHAPMSAAI